MTVSCSLILVWRSDSRSLWRSSSLASSPAVAWCKCALVSLAAASSEAMCACASTTVGISAGWYRQAASEPLPVIILLRLDRKDIAESTDRPQEEVAACLPNLGLGSLRLYQPLPPHLEPICSPSRPLLLCEETLDPGELRRRR